MTRLWHIQSATNAIFRQRAASLRIHLRGTARRQGMDTLGVGAGGGIGVDKSILTVAGIGVDFGLGFA